MIEGITPPEFQESETGPKKRVLKISEMALSVDGKYVGEVGNPSYRHNPARFEYDPDPNGGLIITGQRETVELDRDDLVKIPHALGSVTIDRIFRGQKSDLKGEAFETELYKIYGDTKKKIDQILMVGETLGLVAERSYQTTAYYINRLGSANKNFSPEELYDYIIGDFEKALRQKYSPDELAAKGLTDLGKQIKRTGILNEKLGETKSIVDYYYLFGRLHPDYDPSDADSIYRSLDHFPYLEELLNEYKRSPDARFGDPLLIALERTQTEMDREYGSDSLGD